MSQAKIQATIFPLFHISDVAADRHDTSILCPGSSEAHRPKQEAPAGQVENGPSAGLTGLHTACVRRGRGEVAQLVYQGTSNRVRMA